MQRTSKAANSKFDMPLLISKCVEFGQKMDDNILRCTKKAKQIAQTKKPSCSFKNVNNNSASPAVKSIRVQLKKDYTELLEMLEEVNSYSSTKSKGQSLSKSNIESADSNYYTHSMLYSQNQSKAEEALIENNLCKRSTNANNSQYHLPSDIPNSCNSQIMKDRTLGRFFIKRKRSEIKDLRGMDIAHLQIKKIELKPKKLNKKEINSIIANNFISTKATKGYRKRSFSPIQENSESLDISSFSKDNCHKDIIINQLQLNRSTLSNTHKQKSRTHNFEKCNTNEGCIAEEYNKANVWGNQKPKPNHSANHSADRKSTSQCRKTRIAKEGNQNGALNKSMIDKPKKQKGNTSKSLKSKELKKKHKEIESPIVQPKKPPVPRFKFVVRTEKEDNSEKVIEKPKPKPHPPPVFQCNDFYFVN